MNKVYQVVVYGGIQQEETIVATFSNPADAEALIDIIEERDYAIVREVRVDKYKPKLDRGLTPYKVTWFVDKVPLEEPQLSRPVFSLDEDFEIRKTIGNKRIFIATVWARDEEHAKQKMRECLDDENS